MRKVTEFPDRRVVTEEAVKWLIQLDADTPLSADALQDFREWLARSPAYAEEMVKLGVFWSNLELTELNIPLVKSSMEVLAQQRAASDLRRESQSFWRDWFGSRAGWAVAVSALVGAVLFQQLFFHGGFGQDDLSSTNAHYVTAVGELNTVKLADGSAVSLNTNSQIKVEFSEHFRNIRLVQGEAHFKVAKNDALPFRVYAGQGRVEAVGTAFTVYLREQDMEVLVTEGKVDLAVQSSNSSVVESASSPIISNDDLQGEPKAYYVAVPVKQLGFLEAGQGATILTVRPNDLALEQHDQAVKPMDVVTRKRRDSWRDGVLLFTGDSLEEVVNEISRYTTVSIEIVDPELKKIRIGGQFRVGDVDGMFAVLETNFGLNITRLDYDRVQISAAEQ